MLTCVICGEELLFEEDMKTHILLSHLEDEASCPLCSLSGVSYDELTYHMNTAHPENHVQAQEPHRGDTVPSDLTSCCPSSGTQGNNNNKAQTDCWEPGTLNSPSRRGPTVEMSFSTAMITETKWVSNASPASSCGGRTPGGKVRGRISTSGSACVTPDSSPILLGCAGDEGITQGGFTTL